LNEAVSSEGQKQIPAGATEPNSFGPVVVDDPPVGPFSMAELGLLLRNSAEGM
jgi:hypothetical protein